MSVADDQTPIERPLLRSDLNEVRAIVWDISAKLLELNASHEEMKNVLAGFTIVHDRTQATEERLKRIERRLWAPTAVQGLLLLLTCVAALVR